MKTRDELHIAFKIEIDKNGQATAFGGVPAFLPEEIDYWLNEAIVQEVNNKFTGNNSLRQPFESSVKRIDDLANLVKVDILGLESKDTNELISTDTLTDYMYFVSAFLNFDNEKAAVQLVNHNTVSIFKQTYNNNPYIENPVATIDSTGFHIYYDTHTMQANDYKLELIYVKYPTKVEDYPEEGIDEFPDYMWYEIVNRAVVLALEDIESQRTQSKSQLNQVNE